MLDYPSVLLVEEARRFNHQNSRFGLASATLTRICRPSRSYIRDYKSDKFGEKRIQRKDTQKF